MQKYLAEFFGTCFFLYVILATGNAIAIGAALAVVIMIIGPISGGYVNPAVTFAMAYHNKIAIKEILPYCLAQILGALTAVQLLKYVQI
jgi:aquaporin Z